MAETEGMSGRQLCTCLDAPRQEFDQVLDASIRDFHCWIKTRRTYNDFMVVRDPGIPPFRRAEGAIGITNRRLRRVEKGYKYNHARRRWAKVGRDGCDRLLLSQPEIYGVLLKLQVRYFEAKKEARGDYMWQEAGGFLVSRDACRKAEDLWRRHGLGEIPTCCADIWEKAIRRAKAMYNDEIEEADGNNM